jgi:hypothetical protein
VLELEVDVLPEDCVEELDVLICDPVVIGEGKGLIIRKTGDSDDPFVPFVSIS